MPGGYVEFWEDVSASLDLGLEKIWRTCTSVEYF